VDGFVPNFMGRFLGGKGRPSSCFVTKFYGKVPRGEREDQVRVSLRSVEGCGSNDQKTL